jgi:hypothetical protein
MLPTEANGQTRRETLSGEMGGTLGGSDLETCVGKLHTSKWATTVVGGMGGEARHGRRGEWEVTLIGDT